MQRGERVREGAQGDEREEGDEEERGEEVRVDVGCGRGRKGSVRVARAALPASRANGRREDAPSSLCTHPIDLTQSPQLPNSRLYPERMNSFCCK